MTNIQNLIKTHSKYSIDSLCIRTPLKYVTDIDLCKIGKVLLVNEVTGQIESTKNRSHKHSENNLINTYYSIIEYQLNGNKYKELQTLVSSKILTKSYFTGITKENISYIYRKIQSYGIAKYSYESFLKSNVYDVDIKKDISSKKVNTIILLEAISKKSKTEFKLINTLKNSKKKDNLGLQYGNRTGNKNKDVNLKFYQKEIELVTRSFPFFKEYFSGKIMPETIRVEFNIKNQRKFNRLGINKKFNLENVLNLKQIELNEMFNKSVEYHIINPEEVETTKRKIGNTKSEELIEMLLCVPNQKDYYLGIQAQYIYSIKWIKERIIEKSKRSRYLKEIEEKYIELINQKPKDLSSEKEILKTLKKLFN